MCVGILNTMCTECWKKNAAMKFLLMFKQNDLFIISQVIQISVDTPIGGLYID